MSSISGRSDAGSAAGVLGRKLKATAGAASGPTKPTMEIHIDNHYRSKTYGSGSVVRGRVTISAPARDDVRFDAVQILLLGTTRTGTDGYNIPQSTSHTFLRLSMPVPESGYPVPRLVEAGRTFDVPFNFVVPGQLTLSACGHSVINDAVRDYHTQPPPTMGSWDRDDLAPDMSRIEYAVKARLLRDGDEVDPLHHQHGHHPQHHQQHHQNGVRILEASQEIRVLPAYPEDPPLSISENDKLYTPWKSKTLRRTILSPKLGRVTVAAAQPCAAMLSPDGRQSAGTTAQLDLNFAPSASADEANVAPPKVTAVAAKIAATTYYSASGVRCLPNLGDWDRNFGYEGSGSYSCAISVPAPPTVPQVAWARQRPAASRQDSGYGTSNEGFSDSEETHAPAAAAVATAIATHGSKKTKTKEKTKAAAGPPPAPYTGTLQIPIQLPTDKKTILPTFHSCVTSRIYVLHLTVSLSCGGTASSLALAVPLQIGVEAQPPPNAPSPGNGREAHRALARDPLLPPSFEADADADADADQHLTPRVIAPPPRVAATLPGYADLMASTAPQHGRQVAAY